jgi:hypothetical protein
MKATIPLWKVAATAGGTALTGAAVWLNATHIAHTEGWGSPLVAAGIIVTLCAAVTPPFAERAAKTGQPLKAALLWVFFCLAVSFSLSASIARTSGYADGKASGTEKANVNATLAAERYQTAKEARTAECATKKRGTRCRAAEDALSAARNGLATASPVSAPDPGAARLAAVLGIDAGTVRLYSPLLLPLGLELGGFIFLALGLAPRWREPELGDTVSHNPIAAEPTDIVSASAIEVATPAKRGGRDYYLRRLERDHAAIAKRVHAGELSVYAASVAAGLRKAAAKRKWDANEYAKVDA